MPAFSDERTEWHRIYKSFFFFLVFAKAQPNIRESMTAIFLKINGYRFKKKNVSPSTPQDMALEFIENNWPIETYR